MYDDLLKNDRTLLAQDLQDSMATVLNLGASASLWQAMKADKKYVAVIEGSKAPLEFGCPQDIASRC